MKNMITELLSPAGSYESFEAAIGAGADAVYVGGPAFGARAYAQNFTQEELITAIETAHIHNCKLYLTVNTLLKNRELDDQLFEYLLPYYEAGLDAVIVQDLGVFSFIRRNFPGSGYSRKHTDDSNRTGGNAVSGGKGSNACGSGQRAFPGRDICHA